MLAGLRSVDLGAAINQVQLLLFPSLLHRQPFGLPVRELEKKKDWAQREKVNSCLRRRIVVSNVPFDYDEWFH